MFELSYTWFLENQKNFFTHTLLQKTETPSIANSDGQIFPSEFILEANLKEYKIDPLDQSFGGIDGSIF